VDRVAFRNPMVVCGFPGIGKTTSTKEYKNFWEMCDLDSSEFYGLTDWPLNYINKIKDLSEEGNEYEIIFISTHKEVRTALRLDSIPYCIALPNKFGKEKYIEYYRNKKSSNEFIEKISESWDILIDDLINDNPCIPHLFFGNNSYLDYDSIKRLHYDYLCRANMVFV
jgi:hypothetical protein